MELDRAGIKYAKRSGITVSDRLQTSNPNVYAAGDVCMKHKFTHAADAAARIVIQNALFKGRKKITSLIIPKCTYTSPEIASVGLTEKDAVDQNLEYAIFKVAISELDRAQTDSETEGFIKVITDESSSEILGVHLIGHEVGELIGGMSLAMNLEATNLEVSANIFPHPTISEVFAEAFHMIEGKAIHI